MQKRPNNKAPFSPGDRFANYRIIGTYYAFVVVLPIGFENHFPKNKKYYLTRWEADLNTLTMIGEFDISDKANFFKASFECPMFRIYANGRKYTNYMAYFKRIFCRYLRAQSVNTYVIRTYLPARPEYPLALRPSGQWDLFIPQKTQSFKSVIHARLHAQWMKANLPTSLEILNASIYCIEKRKTYKCEGNEKQTQLMDTLLGGYQGNFHFTKDSQAQADANAQSSKPGKGQSSDPFGGLL